MALEFSLGLVVEAVVPVAACCESDCCTRMGDPSEDREVGWTETIPGKVFAGTAAASCVAWLVPLAACWEADCCVLAEAPLLVGGGAFGPLLHEGVESVRRSTVEGKMLKRWSLTTGSVTTAEPASQSSPASRRFLQKRL